jgi:hypothetical protein
MAPLPDASVLILAYHKAPATPMQPQRSKQLLPRSGQPSWAYDSPLLCKHPCAPLCVCRTPDQIPGLSGVEQVSAGWKHSACVTSGSRLLTWGWGGSQGEVPHCSFPLGYCAWQLGGG